MHWARREDDGGDNAKSPPSRLPLVAPQAERGARGRSILRRTRPWYLRRCRKRYRRRLRRPHRAEIRNADRAQLAARGRAGIAPRDGHAAAGGLALALALERRAGAKSRWAPYVDSLPRDAPLPLWSAAEPASSRHGLDATSRRRARLADNYRAGAAVWADGELKPLYDDLRETTLGSSRAFDVDSAHGVGLLPLIDALNHKPALAPAHGGEASDDDDSEDEDVDNALRRDCAIRIPPAEESDDDDDDDEEDDGALIETLRPLRAGEELCLTYGNYGNYELLAGYGFTLDDNPFETALLCWEHVVAAAEAVLGARDARRQLAELRAEGAAAVGRPFVFDRRATAPPELVGLLRRLADDAKSRDAILKRAVKAQVAGYGSAVTGQKRRRTDDGDDATAHAARLVRGELEIWEAAAAGGRVLEGREADAAEAAAAARRLRVD